jgi:hypothetical protein
LIALKLSILNITNQPEAASKTVCKTCHDEYLVE